MFQVILVPGGPRPELLLRRAYEEEGLACPAIDERVAPTKLLFPRSFVDGVNEMPGEKSRDYCFVGSLYRSETYDNRDWILDFARQRFSDRSYFLLSESPGEHQRLGPFDHTGEDQDVFVPKNVPEGERAFFNRSYFEVLRSSEFTLCPARSEERRVGKECRL